MRRVRWALAVAAGVALACAGGSETTDEGGYDFGQIHVDYGSDGSAGWDPGADATRCVSDNECGGDTPYCDQDVKVCVACRTTNDCQGTGYCVQGSCHAEMVCQPNSRNCSRNKARICSADGLSIAEEECGDLVCFEGSCLPCAPGSVDCPQINVARLCRLDGSGWDETQCGDLRCVNGQCVACVPNQRICQGSAVMACVLDGSGFAFQEDCDTENTGRLCHLGTCLNLCDFNAKFKTNQGCEYWTTDLDQFREAADKKYGGGENAPYAIVVSNTNANFKASVRVTNQSGFDKTFDAPPKTATIISLDPNNIRGSGISDHAWHLTSTLPIVAYQFNPLENVSVFSNDASLLLPTSALGKKYRVMSWPSIGVNSDNQQLASFMTIVAAEGKDDETTEVTVTTKANVAAGSGVTAFTANTPKTFSLKRGQVLNLEAADTYGDFTGSLIEATRKIAVFGGHVCANAPIAVAACDHLEEQIQPLGTLGRKYVIARTMARGKAPDILRVLGVQDDTKISGTKAGLTIPTLNAGDFYEFEITDHIELSSDKPFMVGHFLEGQNAPGAAHDGCYDSDLCESVTGVADKACICVDDGTGYATDVGKSCTRQSDCDVGCLWGELCEVSTRTGKSCSCGSGLTCTRQANCSPDDANIGDPSQIMGVPIEQFRSEYVFLVPIKYRNNYVSIVAPVDATVNLNGSQLQSNVFQVLPSNQWKVTRLPLNPGSHTISADKRVGIEVYGWDFYVSYGYPGGMNIETLAVY